MRNIERKKFKEILEQLDNNRQFFDLKLTEVLTEKSQETELTYAEIILLVEGSQTGRADCTLPPYVIYEANTIGNEEDTYIRSEILEWCLDSNISKTILKNGFLEIEGATILSSLDYNAKKLSLNSDTVKHDRDEQFSLDLSSQRIEVDLNFKNSKFVKGVNVKDSYTENLSFIGVDIGKSIYNDANIKEISFDATNSTIGGDLTISTVLSGRIKSTIDSRGSIQGDIKIDFAKIDSSLNLKSSKERNFLSVTGEYLEARVVKLENSFFSGGVNFSYSTISQALLITNSTITGVLNVIHSQGAIFDLNRSIFEKPVNIYFSQFQKIFCTESKFKGYPYSLNASGVKSTAVFFRDGFVALYGVQMHKAEIEGDLDCREGYFGFSDENSIIGRSFIFRNSKAKNVYFSKGFIAIGEVDLSATNINNVYFDQGLFINPYENNILIKKKNYINNNKTFAVYAKNAKIGNKITFNSDLSQLDKIYITNHTYKIIHIHTPIDYNFAYYKDDDTLHSLFEIKFSNDDQTKVEQLKVEYSELNKKLENYNVELKNIKHQNNDDTLILENEYFIKNIDIYINKYIEISELLIEIINNYNIETEKQKSFVDYKYSIYTLKLYFIANKKLDLFVKGFGSNLNFLNFSLIYGETLFEEAEISGHVDCAGAVCYRELDVDRINNLFLYQSAIQRKTLLGNFLYNISFLLKNFYKGFYTLSKKNHPNALSINHSLINGTLYINQKNSVSRLPFLARGEVDLRYTSIKKLAVSPKLATHDKTRWNLIGLTYETIYSDNESNDFTTIRSLSVPNIFSNIIFKLNNFITYFKPGIHHKVTIESCEWIYPYYGIDNFRQPYEQLANALFQSGEDIKARQVIVNKTPSRNILEEVVMFFVRVLFSIGFPIQRALIWIIVLFILGCITFRHAVNKNLIISADSTKSYVPTLTYTTDGTVENIQDILITKTIKDQQGKKVTKTKIKKITSTVKEKTQLKIDSNKIAFDEFSYSFQKLLPLIDGEQEENFTANYDPNNKYFIAFYNVYPIFGAFFVGMIILSLARMRKNSS